MPRGDDGSSRAARRVLTAIRMAKPYATGKVFKALHVAEGMLSVALQLVSYARRHRRKGKRNAKAPKEPSPAKS